MTQQSPVTRLSEAEAWELLRSSPVGRLATVINRQPDVFPVNFVVEGTSVIFRTAEGSKLLQVTVNERVAFQADGWVTDTGWSVVAKGRRLRWRTRLSATGSNNYCIHGWPR